MELRRGGASTRFHPNRRASIDHRPGPNMARAPAMVPSKRRSHKPAVRVSICQISIRAANAPAIGVQRPGIRRIPHPPNNAYVVVLAIGGPLHRAELAWKTSAEPTTKRRRSSAVPGQPPANVEYKRRNTYPFVQIRVSHCSCSWIPQRESRLSLFRVWHAGATGRQAGRNYSSMIPRFRPIMAAWVRSLAPNLERMDLTRLLTVSSVMES